MMRALYSGVTGLRNHQIKMDIIGNNISNVNTVGFKSSRVVFQDMFCQSISAAAGANGVNNGGVNPKQVGLGMKIASVDTMHNTSATQYTGAPLDLSIEGEGFFVFEIDGELSYSRAGNFYTDENNYLVTASGAYVQGFGIDPVTGVVSEDPATMTNILIDPAYYDVSIDRNGAVIGLDKATNNKVVIGQVMIANFPNSSGLEKIGNNTYRTTVNSGDPAYSWPGKSGAGFLNPGTLEMSNVDLAGEFTDMITTQRGFQANSRIITTTDSMLEEIVNLKR